VLVVAELAAVTVKHSAVLLPSDEAV
jgi:hypothetical protein